VIAKSTRSRLALVILMSLLSLTLRLRLSRPRSPVFPRYKRAKCSNTSAFTDTFSCMTNAVAALVPLSDSHDSVLPLVVRRGS